LFKKLLLRNHVVDFIEIYNICARKAIIETAKMIINSDKVCNSYSDLNFGITFLEQSVYWSALNAHWARWKAILYFTAFTRGLSSNNGVIGNGSLLSLNVQKARTTFMKLLV